MIPDPYQNALPTLAFGRFLNWLRESEITADRAGLLCCQNPKTAYNALIRQLHGLAEGRGYLDPADQNFDERRIIANFQRWQNEPLVKFIVYAKRFSAESPLIPDRLAALKAWVKSGRYDEILKRSSSPAEPKLLVIDWLVLKNVTALGSVPYVVVRDEDGKEVLRTPQGPKDSADVNFDDLETTLGGAVGEPIFFEIWDGSRQKIIGGFFVQASEDAAVQNVRIQKDWKERVTIVSPSFAKAKVRVEDKVKE